MRSLISFNTVPPTRHLPITQNEKDEMERARKEQAARYLAASKTGGFHKLLKLIRHLFGLA